MDIRVGPEPEVRAAAWIAGRLRNAIGRRRSASLAVSGGGTAQPMIDALAGLDVEWPSVTIWQVDERIAADGDPARNAEQLAGMSGLGCGVRLMPVTSDDLRAAARRYASSLPERFDVVHLGLGTDGHTASWPPGVDEVRDSARSVELTPEFNGRRRMTLTRSVVNQARSRVVLATGAPKRPMVERWLLDDRSLPVSALRRSGTWVFLDGAAAPNAVVH